MKKQARFNWLVVLIFFMLVVSLVVLGSSIRLLPDAPLYPTPTYPKGIDFPDLRPVPR